MSNSWAADFKKVIQGAEVDMSYEEGAAWLRRILRSGLLSPTDIRDNPERFFLAHTLVAADATRVGPGFWIRFTVQYNLFAGTVMALGRPDQIESLKGTRLGCFGLTEVLAGVNSGLVVQTKATYDAACDEFVIDTPTPGASKNWISQGLVADRAIVIADLTVGEQSYGAQAFLVPFRDPRTGRLIDGIVAADMGRKTIGNDLDNARLTFRGYRCKRSNLCSRYLEVGKGGHVTRYGNKRTMEMIGQRLFTGRVAVAQAALTFTTMLFHTIRDYAEKKLCWAPKGARPHLASIPQLKALLAEGERSLAELKSFVNDVEVKLCKCLREDSIPSVELQEAIACCKVSAVEETIKLCHDLKQEVGSYALMGGVGFENLDFLQCCKFAEGDSRILMQKMARDCFKHSTRLHGKEKAKVDELKAALARVGGKKSVAWDLCWEEVYCLAGAHIERVRADYRKSKL